MKHYSLSLSALAASAIIGGILPCQADYTPPCDMLINSPEAFDQWTTLDANGDEGDHQWHYSSDGALYVENKSGAADDWLISPAVTLHAGSTYTITLKIQNLSTYGSDKQKFTLNAGMKAEPTSQTSQILKIEDLTKTLWVVDKSGNFVPEETGEYYFGLHLYSASYNGNCLVTGITITEQLSYPGAVTDFTIEAAPEGVLEGILSWTWPTKNNLGGNLSGINGAKIYRANTSSALSVSDTYLIGTLDLDTPATPGTVAGWNDNTIKEPGQYYYMVVPFNENGNSPATPSKIQSAWIGPDKAGSVSNVIATVDDTDDKKIFLTFDLPKAEHGGYLDMSTVGYKIQRTNGSNTITIEENWSGTLPYTDSSIESLDSYYYTVYTVNNGTAGWSGIKSNTVTAGGALSLPYTNTFDNPASISLFTLLKAGDGRDWSVSSSSSKLDYWGRGDNVESYAVLPPIKFETGNAYQIKFDTYVSRSTTPKNLSVCIGREAEASALGEILFEELITSTLATGETITFSVPENGNYYIAFRVNGKIDDSNDIYVDNLKIEEIVASPVAPVEFSAIPAPDGTFSVELAWINPSETNAGTDFETLTQMDIRRNNIVIATLDNLTAGSAGSYTDTDIDVAGEYTYTLTPWLNDAQGAIATALSGWVGVDTPKAPANVTVTIEENGDRLIAFTPVSESVHGGYVDYATLTYEISRNGETIAVVNESPYSDTTDNLELGSYQYGVTAVTTDDIMSETALANTVVFGKPLKLPYEPTFSDTSAMALWTFENPENPDKNWRYNTSKSTIEASFISEGAWAITPPLNMLAGTVDVTAGLSAYNSRYPEKVGIYLIKDLNELENATLIQETNPDNQWVNRYTNNVTIDKTGTYYIGFKLIEPANWTASIVECKVEQSEISTGIESIGTDTGNLIYDYATATLVYPIGSHIVVYTIDGTTVATDYSGSLSVADLQASTYIAVLCDKSGKHTVIKFVK